MINTFYIREHVLVLLCELKCVLLPSSSQSPCLLLYYSFLHTNLRRPENMRFPEFLMSNRNPRKASGNIRFVYVLIISHCIGFYKGRQSVRYKKHTNVNTYEVE